MRRALLAAVVVLLGGGAGAAVPAPASAQAPALVEGAAFTQVVATFEPPLPSQVTIDWADGTPAQPSAVTTNAAGKGEVTASHTYAKHGSYAVKVTDKADPNRFERTYLTIADAPIAVVGASFPVAAAPGGVLVATVADANPLGSAVDFKATVEWGDAARGDATVTAIAGVAGRYEVRAAHAYPDGSSYLAEVTVASNDGGDAKASAQASADGAPEPAPPGRGRVLDFGRGDGPSLQVDEDGTAHLVWAVPAPGRTGDAVIYCRLPRGAKACSVKRRFLVDALTEPVLRRDRNGAMRILVSYNGTLQVGGGTLIISSLDDGATWANAFYRVNTGVFQGGIVDAALSQDGRMLYVLFGDFLGAVSKSQIFAAFGMDRPILNREDKPGKIAPLTGDATADRARLVYSARAVGVLPDGRAVLAGYDTDERKRTPRAALRVVANADGTPTSQPWSPIRGGPVYGLAANLRGVSLIGSLGCQKGVDVAVLRGLTAGAPRPLAADRFLSCNDGGDAHLSVDAAGGRHAVWQSDVDGCQGSGPHAADRRCIVYRRARPGGDFGPKTTIATIAQGARQIQVAAGRDGKGWVVWRELVDGTPKIRITPTITDSEAELDDAHRLALTLKPSAECAKNGPVTVGAQVIGPLVGRPRITGVTWSTTPGLLPRRQVDAGAPFQTRVTIDRREFDGLSSTGVLVFTMTVKAAVRTRVGSKAAKVSRVKQTLSFFCGVPFSRVRK